MTTSGNTTNPHTLARMPVERRRRRLPSFYEAADLNRFDMRRFASPKNLRAAFDELKRTGGDAGGPDGIAISDLKYLSDKALQAANESLRRRTYVPSETRVCRILKKSGNGFRKLSLPNVFPDRTISKALQKCVTPYFQSVLPRLGQDALQIFAQMEKRVRKDKAYILALDDVKNCFPNANLDMAMDCFRNHTTNPELIWLIEQIIRGHEGRNPASGLDQGSPFSPLAMELLLRTYLDLRMETEVTGFCPSGFQRFVDNLILLWKTESECEDLIEGMRIFLDEIGMELKSEDGPPVDIRDPDHGAKVLGLVPYWSNGRLNFRIPEQAFDDLKEGLGMSPNPKVGKLVVTGWIHAVGPALTRKAAKTVLGRISDTCTEACFHEITDELCKIAKRAKLHWESVRRNCV